MVQHLHYIAERRKAVDVEPNLSRSTIDRHLRIMRIAFNKVIHAAEQNRPDVARKRVSWKLMQVGLDPTKLVFNDETPGGGPRSM